MRSTVVAAAAISAALFPTLGVAGPFSLNGQERWIVFASRRTQVEAVRVADELSWKGTIHGLRVVRAANGWFGVIAGPMHVADPSAVRSDFVRKGAPTDLLFSRGDTYETEVWRKYDGGEPITMRVGELIVRVASVSSRTEGERVPVATGLLSSHVVFTMRLDESPSRTASAELTVIRLDKTAEPQLVFTSNWGGAHCCTMTKIATTSGQGWQIIPGKTLDGGGYSLTDLDGDGIFELVSSDNSFLYAFASYAESRSPLQITKLVNDRLVDVTKDPKFQPYLREYLNRLEREAGENDQGWKSRGFLAGWVATKALVGEFEDAWKRALVLYERNSDWPLTECTVPLIGGTCSKGAERQLTFPVALKKHLERTGYIPAAREPTPSATVPPPSRPSSAVPTSSGTGFYVTSNGHVVTNEHVVDGCGRIEVRTATTCLPADLLARDKSNDLALLKVDRATTKAPSIRTSIRVGEPVAAFGFPLSSMLASSGNFTLGNVTALAGIGDDTRYLQISAPVQPGSSGGPLLDERGNLVGVVTSKLNALKTAALIGDFPQNVNFAIKASALTAFRGSNRIEAVPPSASPAKDPADLADEAVSISVMVRCQ